MKALITAGRSNRLRPFTDTKNKHLIELANKPMIFYAIEKVASAGIEDIGIIVEENSDEIQNRIHETASRMANITYIPQTGGAKGVAHAISCARQFLQDDSFMLYLGDNIVEEDILPLREKFEKNNLNCLLTITKIPKPERFGVPHFDSQGKIIKVEERPIDPKSPYAVAGLYFYDKNVHSAFPHIKPSFRGDYEISDLHTWLAQNGYRVDYQEIKNWWKDRGSADDLLSGNRMILENLTNENKGSVDESVRIEGVVKIGEGTKIGGRSVIRGPVTIGEYCLIKDSYVGPYTSLGNKVELHSTEIENSILYSGTSIMTPQKITSSVIGEDSLISNADHETPKGKRLIVGDNSSISI